MGPNVLGLPKGICLIYIPICIWHMSYIHPSLVIRVPFCAHFQCSKAMIDCLAKGMGDQVGGLLKC